MKVIRFKTSLRFDCYYKFCCNHVSVRRLSGLPKAFKAKEIEYELYETWEKNNYFAIKDKEKAAVKMLLPPPNVTGTLHLGHALTVTIQDILARWYRMKGHPVIWVPGFDHAGIATQMIMEKHLLKTKGIKRSDIGREEFLSYIWQWKDEKQNVIRSQMKSLGASLDWSREYFTLSKDHNKAVIEAFVILNDRNLLYKKKDLVNWSPALSSTISEIEVERLYVTQKTKLQIPGYNRMIAFGEMARVAYPVKDSSDEIVVATTRPETLFGDVAIAVHPEDERYARYIGKEVWHALRETYIPVVSDASVDREFGTGAVKVTPAHDPLDYAIAANHGLEAIQVIDEQGNITEAGKQFKGLPRFIAREKVLTELANRDLLKGIYDHTMCVPLCSRSRDVVEYQLKEQWFIRCKEMAERAAQAVRQGRLKLIPATHEQAWFEYLDNIKDWCVSRQIWWGHPIPAYYVTVEGEPQTIVARTEDDARTIAINKYGTDAELLKEEDVLDTWFSSAILPFAAMGWPRKTEDLEKYYPLTLMETGSDILFFWVARMAMLGLELTDRLPFDEVLLHGLLCDAYGKKMSKTLGNIVAPENIINGVTLNELEAQLRESCNAGVVNEATLKRMLAANKKSFPNGIPDCGADTLRMTLCSHNIKNQHINLDVMECQTNKNFMNKILQASKYVLLTVDGKTYEEPKNMEIIDRWILSRLSLMIDTIDKSFEQRNFHKAIASMKQFFYYEFCDFYLEATKWGFKGDSRDTQTSHTYGLIKCLEAFLRASAPVLPYMSDYIYKRLSNTLSGFLSVPSLMEAPYPLPEQFNEWRDVSLDERIDEVLKVVLEIRSITAKISKKSNPEVHISTSDPEKLTFYNDVVSLMKGGSRIFNIFVYPQSSYQEKKNSVSHFYTPDCTLSIIAEDPSVLKQVEKNIFDKTQPVVRKKSAKSS